MTPLRFEVEPLRGASTSGLGALAALLSFLGVLAQAGVEQALRAPWIFWLGGLLILMWMLADRAHRLRRVGEAVTLDESDLGLPPALTGGAQVRLRYEDVTAMSIAEQGEVQVLLVHTAGRRFALSSKRFVDPRAVGLLARALLARSRGMTDAQAHMAVTSVQHAVAAMPDPPSLRVTPALIGIISLTSLWVLIGLRPDEGDAALLWGANARSLLEQGQWFRLATATFVHGGMLHLTMNLLALWGLARPLERLLGASSVLAIALFAGWIGALVSALGHPTGLSVGASTSVFGLFGALAVLQVRFGARMPPHMRPSRSFWIQTILMNAALLLIIPNLDHWGHLGGFVGGALATALLDLSPLAPASLKSVRVRALAAGLALLHLAGLFAAAGRDAHDRRVDRDVVLKAMRGD